MACGLVLLAGLGIAVLLYKGFQLNSEGTAFVDAAIPAISAHWDTAELLDRATPELKQTARPADVAKLFERLRPLGKLTKYNGATGNTHSDFDSSTGTTIKGEYTATAEYQNGTATFQVVAVKRDGRWMINGFYCDTKLASGADGGKAS
jgi:hypothetical protein